jgi:high-affinity iron transporter
VPKLRSVLSVLALALSAVALMACGDDDKGSTAAKESSHAAASPAVAIAEIGEVRGLLDQAEAEVKAGDRKAADSLLGDAYLEHFEEVEGPLGKKDHELMESLEEAISTELREKIKSGAAATEVAPLFDDVRTNLDKAEAALK